MMRGSWFLAFAVVYALLSLAVAFSIRDAPVSIFILFTTLMIVLMAKRSVENRLLLINLIQSFDVQERAQLQIKKTEKDEPEKASSRKKKHKRKKKVVKKNLGVPVAVSGYPTLDGMGIDVTEKEEDTEE